jgi:hypothetical protein
VFVTIFTLQTRVPAFQRGGGLMAVRWGNAMTKTTRLMAGLVLAASLGTELRAQQAISSMFPAGAKTPVLIGFVEGEPRLAVWQAVEGAAARLSRPGCREVLSDFADESGQKLQTKLPASGRSPAHALTALRFFDDGAAP